MQSPHSKPAINKLKKKLICPGSMQARLVERFPPGQGPTVEGLADRLRHVAHLQQVDHTIEGVIPRPGMEICEL